MQVKFNNIAVLVLLFFISVIMTACSHADDYSKVRKDLSGLKIVKSEYDFDSIYKLMPDYTQISKTINNTGTEFNRTLLIPLSLTEKTYSSQKNAILLGMLTANIAYIRHYERVQLCMDYFDALRNIANKLAIGSSDFNKLVADYEGAMYENENILAISDSLLNHGSRWFNDAQLYGLSSLWISGFWLETLYIGIVNANCEDENVSNALNYHFDLLTYVDELLGMINDDDYIDNLQTKFLIFKDNKTCSKRLKQDVEKLRMSLLDKS